MLHGLNIVLVVFEDTVAPVPFLRITREEITRNGVDVPLWTVSREDLEAAGPLGATWSGRSGPELSRPLA